MQTRTMTQIHPHTRCCLYKTQGKVNWPGQLRGFVLSLPLTNPSFLSLLSFLCFTFYDSRSPSHILSAAPISTFSSFQGAGLIALTKWPLENFGMKQLSFRAVHNLDGIIAPWHEMAEHCLNFCLSWRILLQSQQRLMVCDDKQLQTDYRNGFYIFILENGLYFITEVGGDR